MSNIDRFKKTIVPGAPDHWIQQVASGTVLEVSDLLAQSTGKVVLMATNTDNLAFVGPSLQAHLAANPSGPIEVGKPNGIDVYEYDLDTATDVTACDLFQWNAKQKIKKSTTNPIAMAVESKKAASSVRVVFLIPAVTNGPRAVGDAS